MDISRVPELVEATGYSLMLDAYESVPTVRQLVAEVVPIPSDRVYGDRGQVITNVGHPEEVEDGQEIQDDDIASGYTWRCKMRRYGRRLSIPFRVIQASNGVARVTDLVSTFASGYGETFNIVKEDFLADMFQKGTLTAGSLKYFDGTFENETDTAPKFIYDGLPWFDGAHTLSNHGDTKSNINTGNALTSANLQTALTQMKVTNAVNERGDRVVIRPDTLLIPSGAMEFTARQLLDTVLLPGTANNDVNVVQGIVNPIPWRALDDTTSASSWWLGQAGKGIRFYDSGAPQFRFATNELKQMFYVIAYGDFGGVVTNWRFWLSNNKAAA